MDDTAASTAPVPSTAPELDAAGIRDAVETALAELLDEQRRRVADLGPDAAALIDAAASSLAGGKRLRAQFCWWGFRAVREPRDDAELRALARACAAWELLHASALVHDDLMDASDTRRGRPAVHRAFEHAHRAAGWTGDPEQYGGAAAILLGDLLLTWADEMLRRCGLPAGDVLAALEVFDLCRSEVIAGQFLDVSVQARGVADEATAMGVLRYKSAKYSIERPLQLGAALGGGDDADREALGGFGLPLGEAFQLRDDQLGVFGEPATTGKPAGDDLVEGKRTVLVALALEALPDDAAARLDAALGTALDEGQVAALRALIADSGASDQVEQRIASLTADALAGLDRLRDRGLPDAAHAALHGLAEAATRRSA